MPVPADHRSNWVEVSVRVEMLVTDGLMLGLRLVPPIPASSPLYNPDLDQGKIQAVTRPVWVRMRVRIRVGVMICCEQR